MKYLRADNTEDPGVEPKKGTPLQFQNGILTASFPLEIPTQFFLARIPHMIFLDAKLRGTTLSGYALACALDDLPHFNVPFYIRFDKAKE